MKLKILFKDGRPFGKSRGVPRSHKGFSEIGRKDLRPAGLEQQGKVSGGIGAVRGRGAEGTYRPVKACKRQCLFGCVPSIKRLFAGSKAGSQIVKGKAVQSALGEARQGYSENALGQLGISGSAGWITFGTHKDRNSDFALLSQCLSLAFDYGFADKNPTNNHPSKRGIHVR